MHVSETGRMGLYLYDAKNYQKYQTLSYLVLLKEKKQQLLQEEMRLLYVAMTRAKQKLFLPLQLGRKEKMIARQLQNKDFSKEFVCRAAVSSANCMAFWIWYVLYCRQDAEFLKCMHEWEARRPLPEETDFSTLSISYTAVSEEQLDAEQAETVADALPEPDAALQAENQ